MGSRAKSTDPPRKGRASARKSCAKRASSVRLRRAVRHIRAAHGICIAGVMRDESRLPVVLEALVPFVRSSETLVGSVPDHVVLSVFCPNQSKYVDVETCGRCPRCVEVCATAGGFVQCRTTKESVPIRRQVTVDATSVYWANSVVNGRVTKLTPK